MGLQKACLHWIKQRTNLEKTLMSISIILLLTCVLLILVGFVYKKNSGDEEHHLSSCQSAECYQTSGEMLSMMDTLVNPCEDFYDYACGKFERTHSAPLDRSEASKEQQSFDSIQLQLKRWLELPSDSNNVSAFEKARILYSKCMDYGSQESKNKSLILRIIKEQVHGEWPALDATWDSTILMEKYLASLISLDVSVAFKLDILPDPTNPNTHIAQISPGSPFLVNHRPDELRGNAVLRLYLVSALTLLGVSENIARNNVEDLLQVDHYFFRIKEQADKECGHPDGHGDDLGTRRVISFTELDDLMRTEVNWTSLLEDVFRVIDKPAVSAIDVYCRRYIRDYIEYFHSHLTTRQAFNYLATRFFLTFVTHLGPSFHEVHRNYVAQHPGSKLLRPFQVRWKECVLLVEKYMLPVMATAYAQDLSDAVEKEGRRISDSIKDSFQHLLPSWSWIEEHKRKWIKQKISEVDFEIALMKYSQDVSQVDALFSKLHLSQDHLILNIMKLQKFVVTNRLQKLVSGENPDVEWQDMSLTSPENYQYQEGFLSIHFDKVIPPFLRLGQPRFLNYGSLGFFLSREMAHYTFISGEINQKFSSCLSNQYSHYNIGKINVKVDGSVTLKENAVDNIAQCIAYEAYVGSTKSSGDDENLPGLQLSLRQNFFLSFAQAFCEVRDIDGYKAYANSTYAPSKVRVNAVLRNFHKFSEAYNCPIGSQMNPSQKCNF